MKKTKKIDISETPAKQAKRIENPIRPTLSNLSELNVIQITGLQVGNLLALRARLA